MNYLYKDTIIDQTYSLSSSSPFTSLQITNFHTLNISPRASKSLKSAGNLAQVHSSKLGDEIQDMVNIEQLSIDLACIIIMHNLH